MMERTVTKGVADVQWLHLKAIFAEAYELPTTERDSFLQTACDGDDLLLEELRRLFADLESAGDFLNEPPIRGVTPNRMEAETVLINRFRIVEMIGSGGMGQVYRAEDKLSGGQVALKAIRAEIALDVQAITRLRRELRLSRQVTHSNVCKVFELWSMPTEDRGDLLFLTMELLRGETLAQRLRRGKLSAREALPIARQIAAGLTAVHRVGIVHRDVKPSNVYLVTDEGQSERAVVTDFGLARPLSGANSAELTVVGAMLGTPAYMAPELFEGKEATVASDIYGLGVTLCEMVTGQNRPIAVGGKLAPRIHKGWQRAITQCLDPNPAKRPASADAAIRLIEKQPGNIWVKRGVAVAAAAILGLGVLFSIPAREVPKRTPDFSRVTYDRGLVQDFSYSADGSKLVYSSDRDSPDGSLNIYLEDDPSADPRCLVKGEWNDYEPSISPDGKLLAFHSDRLPAGVYLQNTAGGSPKLLAPDGRTPRFSSDGDYIAYWTGQGDSDAKSWVVPVKGGKPHPIAPSLADARFPVWSPSGHKLLLRGTALPGWPVFTDWWLADVDTGALQPTGAGPILAKLSIETHPPSLFWDRDSILFSARSRHSTNIWRLEIKKNEVGKTELPVRVTSGSAREVLPWALPNGAIAFANYDAMIHIFRVPQIAGTQIPEAVTSEEALDSRPTVSLDETFLLVRRNTGVQHRSYLENLRSGAKAEVFQKGAVSPAISPNGKLAAYSRESARLMEIWVREIGSGRETKVLDSGGEVMGWLPDGSGVLFMQAVQAVNRPIQLLDLRSRSVSTVLSGAEFGAIAISPGGMQVAYTVRSGGVRSTIYIAPFKAGVPVDLSAGVPLLSGATWDDKPQWAPEGRELFYSSNRDAFMCLWRSKVDRQGHPSGVPMPLAHLHRASMSPYHFPNASFNVAAGAKSVYFNSAILHGNIWKMEP